MKTDFIVLDSVGTIIGLVAWVAGVVLAKGFWSTAAAILFFPYAWYLFCERLMQSWGLL